MYFGSKVSKALLMSNDTVIAPTSLHLVTPSWRCCRVTRC